jgi:hypothetical protein
MKKVKIKDSMQPKAKMEFIKIDNIEDLAKFMELKNSQLTAHVSSLIKSSVPVEKWDHCVGKHGILLQAIIKAKVDPISNPIYHLDSASSQKFMNLSQTISRYGSVLINANGGYCHMVDSFEIIEEVDYDLDTEERLTYTLKENTKYLNLENDPFLENHTKNYLRRLDRNYSFIVNLRSFSNNELIKVFKEFILNGGHTLYVYTTGSDVNQMCDYLESAMKSGLNKVIFEFNAGINNEILSCLEKFDSKGMDVKWESV